MVIILLVLAVLAVIGYWMKKRAPQTDAEKTPDQVLENVADLADSFNRARYQGNDGR